MYNIKQDIENLMRILKIFLQYLAGRKKGFFENYISLSGKHWEVMHPLAKFPVKMIMSRWNGLLMLLNGPMMKRPLNHTISIFIPSYCGNFF